MAAQYMTDLGYTHTTYTDKGSVKNTDFPPLSHIKCKPTD
jgi:hypothetical protein